MTRDEAREIWARSGCNWSRTTRTQRARLLDLLDGHCTSAGAVHGTLRVDEKATKGGSIRCSAFYFGTGFKRTDEPAREMITFQDDGFVGFAGWADDVNIQPILAAFVQWTGELTAGQHSAAIVA